jgi:ribosomal protein L22
MTPGESSKQDKPKAEEGKGPDPKIAEQAEQSAEALAQESAEAKAEEPKPKPKRTRKPAAKKAEGTAAAETGVEKEAGEAALEGAEAEKTTPKPRRRPAAKKEEPAPEPEPAVTVRATARFVRTSPRKARLLTDHIKGKSVDEARAILAFSPRSVAQDWRKLLESAIANAEHNHDLVGDDLRVLNATADEGPTLKRFRPRAMGRATRIRKRTSHLTITLTPKE